MNKRSKQIIVDRAKLRKGLADCALLRGIDIVSRPPYRGGTANSRVAHEAPGRTVCAASIDGPWSNRKGQMERILGEMNVEFRRHRRYDK